MHIVKVKRDGRTDIKETLKFHLSPRVPKHKRRTLKECKDAAKRARQGARLANFY